MRNDQVTSAPSSDVHVQQLRGADIGEKHREQIRRRHCVDFGEGCCKARALGAHSGREYLTCKQIGLGIGPHVGHEVKQHETNEEINPAVNHHW